MYTTINPHHKDYNNFLKKETDSDFINSFKNYDDIILIDGDYEYKYKKFKDYYITYSYCNKYLLSIIYCNYSGQWHREDGPACIIYYQNGKIKNKSYYVNGEKHREDGPAYIMYNNYIRTICFKEYWLDGKKIFL